MVYTERAKIAAVSHGTNHVSAVSARCGRGLGGMLSGPGGNSGLFLGKQASDVDSTPREIQKQMQKGNLKRFYFKFLLPFG